MCSRPPVRHWQPRARVLAKGAAAGAASTSSGQPSFSHCVCGRILRGLFTARGVLIVTTTPRVFRDAVLSRGLTHSDWHDYSHGTWHPRGTCTPHPARGAAPSPPDAGAATQISRGTSPRQCRDTTCTNQLHPICQGALGKSLRGVSTTPNSNGEVFGPDLREIT